jgi:hypothetical protein
MIRICRNFLLVITFMALSAALSAQDNGRFSESVILFGDGSAPPAELDSERGWVPVAAVDWDSRGIVLPGQDDTRRWRLKTNYEHGRSSGPATVQVRLRGPVTGPTFTHPWSEGADRKADTYSNWFEDTESIVGREGRGYVEVRLIAPPRTPLSGRLHSITLEAWDYNTNTEQAVETPAGPVVQLAYARPLPTARQSSGNSANENAVNPELGPEAAMAFSLSFVEACLIGDLPSYYRIQSDPIRSLDDGMAIAKYKLNPPRGISGITGLDDYKRRYDYKIFSAAVYSDLFPEWFDISRPWIPGENSYLFMGHKDRFPAAFPEGVDYLVFLIEPDDEGNWRVVARPGS